MSNNKKKTFKKAKNPTRDAVRNVCNEREAKKAMDDLIKDQSWNDIEEMHKSIVEGIVTLGKTISETLAIENIFEFVEDPNKLNIEVKGFLSDLKSLSEEVAGIKNKYDKYEGDIKDENELILAIDVYQQYQNTSSKLIAVLSPIHSEILLTLNDANDLLVKSKETEDKKDV